MSDKTGKTKTQGKIGPQQVARILYRKSLRNALYIASGGVCNYCGVSLDHSWHADHTIPYSLESKTDPHAMKAVCPRCNHRKGSKLNWGELSDG